MSEEILPIADLASNSVCSEGEKRRGPARRPVSVMHILIVTNYFAPEGGAAAVRLTRLAKGLHRRGHQVTVLTSMPHFPEGRIHDSHRGKAVVTTDLDGVRVVQTWLLVTPSPRISRRLPSQLSFMASSLVLGLRIPRPDVVLVEGQPVFTGVAGMLLALAKRRPYVLNVSDLWPDHLLPLGALTEMHPAYRAARRVVDTTYRRAARIVAMSPRWAQAIASHVPGHEGKITTIYNGVDLDRFQPKLDVAGFRSRHGLGNAKTISFIGSFSTPYDFDTMLSAARHFDRREDVQTVFIGQGSQAAKLHEQIGTFSRLKWIPWLAHEEIPEAWNASWLTYWALRDHPLYEGTIPAKVYEAMACGVPMVAAMKGLTKEIIRESGAGATVPPGDVPGLVREIEKVLAQESLRQRYSQAARHYAERHYDAERIILEYENTLVDAARRPGKAACLLSP